MKDNALIEGRCGGAKIARRQRGSDDFCHSGDPSVVGRGERRRSVNLLTTPKIRDARNLALQWVVLPRSQGACDLHRHSRLHLCSQRMEGAGAPDGRS